MLVNLKWHGKKTKRRIWGLPYKAHNAMIQNLGYNIDLQLDTRVLKFVRSCLITSITWCRCTPDNLLRSADDSSHTHCPWSAHHVPLSGGSHGATDIHVRPLSSAHSTKHPIQRSGN